MTAMVALGALLFAVVPEMNPAKSPFMQALREWKGDFQHVKVGDWVTYELAAQDNMIERGYWRFAVVGEEKDKLGRDAVWIEFDQGEHPKMLAPHAQIRMLVARNVGLLGDGVTRMLLAVGTMKPRELDEGALGTFLGRKRAKRTISAEDAARVQQGDVRVIEGAAKSLLTHAGTVTASPMELRYRSVLLKRFWISEAVPIFRMAKMEVPAIKATMEVRDFGSNARSLMVLPGPNEPKLTVQALEDLKQLTPGPDDGYASPVTDGGVSGDNKP